MSLASRLIELWSRGAPLALPAAVLASLPLLRDGMNCKCWEPLSCNHSAILFVEGHYGKPPLVHVTINPTASNAKTLSVWPFLVAYSTRISIEDESLMKAATDHDHLSYSLLLIREARARLLGIGSVRLQPILEAVKVITETRTSALHPRFRSRERIKPLSLEVVDKILVTMMGIVEASLRLGGPIRRIAGRRRAELFLGSPIPRSTWFRIVKNLEKAGALNVVKGRIEPKKNVDLYFSALWLLDPGLARMETYKLLGCNSTGLTP